MTHSLAISGGKDVKISRPERPVHFIVLLALVLIARSGAAQAPVFATLYSFKGSPDGAEPHAAVVIGKNGALYGTTYMGGANQCATSLGVYQCGTIFELIPNASIPWKEIVLHNFNGNDGEFPNANLVFGSGGTLYGTTTLGGAAGAGTVFDLTPPSTAGGGWTETVLYSFPYDLTGRIGIPKGGVTHRTPGNAVHDLSRKFRQCWNSNRLDAPGGSGGTMDRIHDRLLGLQPGRRALCWPSLRRWCAIWN